MKAKIVRLAGRIGVAGAAEQSGASPWSIYRWGHEPDLLSSPQGDTGTVQRVIDEWRSLKENRESRTLEEFTEKYREKHPDKPLDRRTITKILQGEGLQEVQTRGGGSERYHESVQVYFPGAQAAVDATKCEVSFPNVPPETVTVTKEVAIDMATGAVLGDAAGKEETSEGVKRVLARAREECRSLLAVVSDNGSANRAAVSEDELGEASVDKITRRESALGASALRSISGATRRRRGRSRRPERG